MTEHTHINNPDTQRRLMCKIICGKYLENVGNIGANLPFCVACEVWVSTRYIFQDNFQDNFSLPYKERRK